MTDFPIDTVIFNKIVDVFNQTRSYVLLLFPLAFFIRTVFGFIFLRADSFIEILKDSLFLFLGLFFFTDILKMALQIPYFISSELSFGDWRNINLEEGIFTKALKRIVDWIGIISYWVSFGLYVVIISILGFFAGYILFFGTMFRAYGMLKVFFILLLVVSLWPLLWHSINFAVWTIAVSDNPLANNVIIGGASLAKVFIPLWLISKTSKIPVAETLKKVSFTGGGLAVAGGSRGSHFLSNNTKDFSQNVQNNQEVIAQGAEVNIKERSVKEDYGTFIDNKPADFSIREGNTFFLPEEKLEKPLGQKKSVTLKAQENKFPEVSHQNRIENNIENNVETNFKGNVFQESSLQNNQEAHIENNPQNHREVSPNISQSQSVEPKVETQETTQHNQQIFNEAIHKEDWIEENYIAPRKKEKNKEGDKEL